MKINSIKLSSFKAPLKTPFNTALRSVTHVDDIVVAIETDNALKGLGEAPPTVAITGESREAIEKILMEHFTPLLRGETLDDYERIMQKLHSSISGHTSAKAAIDIAIHDIFAQNARVPLYEYLGGNKTELKTDITVSVNEPQKMAVDAVSAVESGFGTLKIKLGSNSSRDIERISKIREAVGFNVKLIVDANQAWSEEEAYRNIEMLEPFKIELIEQPVSADDYASLKRIKEFSKIPIMADESVFSLDDAKELLEMKAVDFLNIKLMKSGGIYPALKIVRLAQLYGVECMMGSMLEGPIGVMAAAHLAMSQPNFRFIDLDGPFLMDYDVSVHGLFYEGERLNLSERYGLGAEGF